MEDLGNGGLEDFKAFHLKFSHDSQLDREVIMRHVLKSESSMEGHRVIGQLQTKAGLMLHDRWRGISESENTIEPITTIFKDVCVLVLQLLRD